MPLSSDGVVRTEHGGRREHYAIKPLPNGIRKMVVDLGTREAGN